MALGQNGPAGNLAVLPVAKVSKHVTVFALALQMAVKIVHKGPLKRKLHVTTYPAPWTVDSLNGLNGPSVLNRVDVDINLDNENVVHRPMADNHVLRICWKKYHVTMVHVTWTVIGQNGRNGSHVIKLAEAA